jgi:hypothetical protein
MESWCKWWVERCAPNPLFKMLKKKNTDRDYRQFIFMLFWIRKNARSKSTLIAYLKKKLCGVGLLYLNYRYLKKPVWFVSCFEYVLAFARSKCTLIACIQQTVIVKLRKHSLLYQKCYVSIEPINYVLIATPAFSTSLSTLKAWEIKNVRGIYHANLLPNPQTHYNVIQRLFLLFFFFSNLTSLRHWLLVW